MPADEADGGGEATARAVSGQATCYRHPNRETSISCSSCARPLCTDCMVYTPVGIKCPDCARLPRSARAQIKPNKLARAIAAAAIGGLMIGWVLAFLQSMGLFFALILGYLVGLAMSALVLWAAGRYRGVETARAAAFGAIWAYLSPYIIFFGLDLGSVADSLASAPFVVLGAALAAYIAYRRVL